MDYLDPVLIIGVVLAAAGVVSTIGGAVEKIAKLVSAMRAPNAAQDARLKELEEHMEKVDAYLALDKKRLDGLDDGNRVTQRALLALLSHGIDGNNIAQMEQAKAALEEHLIAR